MDSSLGPLQSTMAAKTALRSRIGLNILETLGHGGRLRVGAPFKTTVTSLNGRAVDSDNENVQENVQRPYVKHGITKSNAFSYSSKEYHFVPPAATRGFLWYFVI